MKQLRWLALTKSTANNAMDERTNGGGGGDGGVGNEFT